MNHQVNKWQQQVRLTDLVNEMMHIVWLYFSDQLDTNISIITEIKVIIGLILYIISRILRLIGRIVRRIFGY